MVFRAFAVSSLISIAALIIYSPIVQAQDYVPGEVIVKLKGNSKSIQARAFIGRAVAEKSMTLKQSWPGLNMHHLGVRPGQTVEQALDELRADGSVEYAEPNFIMTKQSNGPAEQVMSNEEMQQSVQAADSGSGSVSASASVQTAAPINLSQAWAAETNGLAPPVVAIIDTGIDFNHTVFVNSGAIWTNPGEIPANGVDDDHNGYIDDVHGWNFVSNTNSPQDDDSHGTHVSGIVLGTTQDISAVPIAAAKIRIMPLKFLDSNGSGSTSNAVSAIYYAVANGAKVLSNSWGGSGFSSPLLDAMAYAYQANVVFVAAAGNASSNNDATPTYPANYNVPNVISVAATDDFDDFAYFSNFGATTVHVGSPGVSILSTLPGNMWGRMSGTSMATPFVSGIAALIVREKPSMNGYQVKQLIESGSQQISSLVSRTSTQARINVDSSMVSAKTASISASEPGYSTSSMRDPASDGATQVAGCGLVKEMMSSDKDGGSPPPGKNIAFFALLAILMSPVVLSIALRQRSGKYRRRYPRYQIDSQVRVKFGDRELVGQVSTISLGGLQLNTDAWLEKGGIVAMSIRSPDGRDEIQVEGQVVWSEEQKRYGVAFANAEESVLSIINRWTLSLLKA